MRYENNLACINVAYCGVHQAFQLALSAQESGWLRRFDCSLYDAPGKWGGVVSRILGAKQLSNRRLEGLDPNLVFEHPWPFLKNWLGMRMGGASETLAFFEAFDRLTARLIDQAPPKLFVGTERCDLLSLQTAMRNDVCTIHDCPQLHPSTLDALIREAADACSVPWSGFPDGEAMKERKMLEYEYADKILVYSEFHRQSFIRAGFDEQRIFHCPLWVDHSFWHAEKTGARRENSSSRLRLLFVGELSLRKGLPFLFRALASLPKLVTLTLVGVSPNEFPIPDKIGSVKIFSLGAVNKSKLRMLYSSHDLLVLPSIADSFGFVALEAMACGLPVLLTENCGAPVPDSTWRVPSMNSDAIAQGIISYLDQPEKLREAARQSTIFASDFTPKRYRNQIRLLYREMLESQS